MTTGGPSTISSRADELLSRLYQQVTEQQAAGYGSEYDIEAGLDRYRTWLRDQAAAADQAAGRAIAALYDAQYQPLVRLAMLLVHDFPTAEEVVQDAFAALHAGMHRLGDNDKALAYLRAAVVNRSRSVLRHRIVVDRHAQRTGPAMPAAELEQFTLIERSAVIAALRSLPVRQREVVVLRFYADLSEEQIAVTLGISTGAVKSHKARAMTSLRAELRKANE
jgi:RNA polymerase sigma-70 factor (sigma-E family)